MKISAGIQTAKKDTQKYVDLEQDVNLTQEMHVPISMLMKIMKKHFSVK